MSNLNLCTISQTSPWKGSLWMRSSVILWYLWISLSAMVPGLNLFGCEVALVLGAYLPLCEGDFCPCVVWLRLANPFCLIFLAQASSSGLLIIPSGPPWPDRLWPRRHPGGFVSWTLPGSLEPSQGVRVWPGLPPHSWHHLLPVSSLRGKDSWTPYVYHVQWEWLAPPA